MPEISKTHMGGTMRLGLRRTVLSSNKCLAARLYGGVTLLEERHRHRCAATAAPACLAGRAHPAFTLPPLPHPPGGAGTGMR